jgi:hypothetical protein
VGVARCQAAGGRRRRGKKEGREKIKERKGKIKERKEKRKGGRKMEMEKKEKKV